MKRFHSKVVMIGSTAMGGNNPIRLQSMTNTPTRNVKATVAQAIRIFEAGADFVRLAIIDNQCVKALPVIRKELHTAGFFQPLVADIHFSPSLAMLVAPFVEKIRINPGNFLSTDDSQLQAQGLTDTIGFYRSGHNTQLSNLINACKRHGTAIRIGTNMGSLPTVMAHKYGKTARAMVETSMEYLRIFNDHGFQNLVVSMKASDPFTTIEAYRFLVQKMTDEDLCYPLHLGVTEAGNGLQGLIKSAIGIGTLLREGIGDTVRVSITEEPEKEISVAKKIVRYATQNIELPEKRIKSWVFEQMHSEELAIEMAIEAGEYLKKDKPEEFDPVAPNLTSKDGLKQITSTLLHLCGISATQTNFVACPGCARKSFDIESLLNDLKKEFGNIPGLKIAVMGCIVNGPGEMEDAHYGLMGTKNKKLWLYKNGVPIRKGIEPGVARQELFAILVEDGWIKKM